MSLPVPAEQTHLTHPKYRADIDGLRAIAVLSVVAFHAFPDWVRGGFVGVDIFFVISGFLISSIILSSLQKGTFSFAEFYARRVKRIFPALIVVMSSCFAFGWLVLLPDEYKQLGKHIAAGAGFVSNFFFWQEAGYFDNAAEAKPLLHLWSLGIEEQFYIVWPLLLYVAWKRKTNFLILAIALAIVSFAFNIRTTYSDITQAFYSPATRFWELSIGGILAYLTLHKINLWDKAMQQIAFTLGKPDAMFKSDLTLRCNFRSIFGMLLIGVAVFLVVHKGRSFPGWWALFPATGAYLIISAGQHAWLNRRILSSRVMVWVGLISYPLYLWHWPLLAFARIIEADTPLIAHRFTAIIMAIALAWLTYKYIEKPIRYSNKSRTEVVRLCIFMIGIGGIGIITCIQDGFPQRSNFENAQKKIADLTWNRSEFGYINCPTELQTLPRLGFCYLSANSAPTIALFGDSHADHIFHGIAKLDKDNTWLFIGNHSCPPVSGISVVNRLVNNCQQLTEKAIRHIIETPTIHTVVLSFFGNYMLDTAFAKDHLLIKQGPQNIKITSNVFATENKIELFYLGLEKSVIEFEKHGISVIVVIDIPELPFLPRDCIRPSLFGDKNSCELSTKTALSRQKELRSIIHKLVEAHPKVRIYDPIGLLCDSNKCNFETDEYLIYRDSHHLSVRGGDYLVSDFLKWKLHN
ncbi:MAG: acyltransferase family protein [Gallionella sp.]